MGVNSESAGDEAPVTAPAPDQAQDTPADAEDSGPRHDPGAAVYGAITAGALLAAESPQAESYADTVGSVIVALLLYWLAHAYADLVGDRMHGSHRLRPAGVMESLAEEAWILAGAVPALAAVGLAAAFGASLAAAMLAAIYTSAGVIVLIEVALGLRARLRHGALAGQILAGAGMGLLIILLRVVLH